MFVGNVHDSRINHDRIEWHGASSKGKEMPDFLTSDDPWFRPVDLQLGPDGALYVADFYNRIIGHYEVPLDTPGPRPRARPDLADRLSRSGWKRDSSPGGGARRSGGSASGTGVHQPDAPVPRAP